MLSLVLVVSPSTPTQWWENSFPIVLHTHHRPALRERLVERLIKLSD
jgi:hypothetical protein